MTTGLNSASTSTTSASSPFNTTKNYKTAIYKEKVQSYMKKGYTETQAIAKVQQDLAAEQTQSQQASASTGSIFGNNSNSSQSTSNQAYTGGSLRSGFDITW